jgi:hypothetical protein
MCLFHTKKDKTDCIRLLRAASADKTLPVDVNYYFAKSCQQGYRFSAAISAYKKYASLIKPEEVQKMSIDQEIRYCENAIKFINDPEVIEVYERKHVSIGFIQNSLTQIESGAKVLLATEDIMSSLDKKKSYRSLFYLTPDKNTLYYSSYGENEMNGKDIYMLKKLGNGKWGVPMIVASVNSTMDEEFPALSRDGKTLYFSSKGFDSMGGYDIFKSTWDETTESWSVPVNMGSPINSPFEDIFFLE